MLKTWQIRRSDTRDRCGECLLPFGKKVRNIKSHSKKHHGYRFPKVCYGCKLLLEKQEKNMLKGFTCGALDLLHAGHILMLKECKEQCSHLIVGLQTDPSIDRPEKHKPIESLEERKIRLEGCKYVDEIIVYETEEDLYKLLKEIKPDVRFLGIDHKDKPFTGESLNIKVIWNSRNHNYSSSNLIQRIKKS